MFQPIPGQIGIGFSGGLLLLDEAMQERHWKTGRTGAVTLIQRFGSALNLNIHFYLPVLDDWMG